LVHFGIPQTPKFSFCDARSPSSFKLSSNNAIPLWYLLRIFIRVTPALRDRASSYHNAPMVILTLLAVPLFIHTNGYISTVGRSSMVN
jgi:hypothetical protein